MIVTFFSCRLFSTFAFGTFTGVDFHKRIRHINCTQTVPSSAANVRLLSGNYEHLIALSAYVCSVYVRLLVSVFIKFQINNTKKVGDQQNSLLQLLSTTNERLDPIVLPWQQHNSCYFLVMNISGTKFEKQLSNISRDILDSVFYCFCYITYCAITFSFA